MNKEAGVLGFTGPGRPFDIRSSADIVIDQDIDAQPLGQVSRVDAAKLAVARAGKRAAGSVAASDAYFPFADGLQVLIDAGVRAVAEPGGSVRDEEVIAAAKEAGITLYFTGTRRFFH